MNWRRAVPIERISEYPFIYRFNVEGSDATVRAVIETERLRVSKFGRDLGRSSTAKFLRMLDERSLRLIARYRGNAVLGIDGPPLRERYIADLPPSYPIPPLSVRNVRIALAVLSASLLGLGLGRRES